MKLVPNIVLQISFLKGPRIFQGLYVPSLQHPQEVLVLLVLNLRIEFGCPKGEAQFALPAMFNFPCISIRKKFGLVF